MSGGGRTHIRGVGGVGIGSRGCAGYARVGAKRRLQHLRICPYSCTHRAQNPAVRHELSFEMGQVHSDMALHFGNNEPVLSREDQVYPLKTSSKASSQKPMWEMLGEALSTHRSPPY